MSEQTHAYVPGLGQPVDELKQLLAGYVGCQLMYVVVKMGIADILRDQPMSCAELAPLLGADAEALYRLLRGMVYYRVCFQDKQGKFGVTPAGACLQLQAPGSIRASILQMGEVDYRAWAALLHTVKTGETAFHHVYGVGYFAYLEQHPALAENFQQLMAAVAQQENASLLEVYDFSPFGRVVDVGGGYGPLLAAVLKAYPLTKGLLFDRPSVVASAQQYVRDTGMGERWELLGGDFFSEVPGGGDLYVLSWIIHDWDDESALRILFNCRRAMTTKATLLLFERIMPEDMDQLPPAKRGDVLLGDLDMLTLSGGRERTLREFTELVTCTGFSVSRVMPTRSSRSIIECIPM